ncbi:MAG: phenylalanine--tRNA ligase subunit beta [Bacteroidales bacterium]|nr:phenylalanine--tRNA ligase subunit beta [Bacteroidales bacterium]
MKVSYNWLKRYIDIDLKAEELGELLTASGLEVEGIEHFQSVKGGLKDIVIGEVLTCTKHPNADKLSITTVNIGEGDPLPIVCGAPNVAAGQKVIVAKVGTTLYQGEQSFTIKKASIRGEESEGMICAEDEVGLGSSHDGIMVLDHEAVPGTPAKEYFNITEDVVFEIGLTPNRTDATSHIGIARDIMAVLNSKKGKRHKKLNLPAVDDFSAPDKKAEIPVIIEDTEACPRFSGLTISGVKVGESPAWMRNLLKAVGIRPINNIVDITNFVLMETGQPLHAYDTAAIEGGKVVVRKAQQAEKFVTLDEIERELKPNDLMICNASAGMCMAGVFGGEKSGVTEKTSSIFLESAFFDPATIRKTAKDHGLATDASFRFERGADINNTLYAMKRATLLICEIAGGKISSEVIDIYPKKSEGWIVDVKYSNINKLIGQEINTQVVENILADLDISIIEKSGEKMKLKVPTYRYDVRREADIIEEILRIYGYNNIDFPEGIRSSLAHHPQPDPDQLQNKLADLLTGLGFSETMNNSLTRSAYAAKYDAINAKNTVILENPLSQDLDAMRQSLLFGGLENILFNQNRKVSDLRFFEFGNIYSKDPSKTRENSLSQYHEEKRLALFICGKKHAESWNTGNENADFFLLKSVVENILKKLGAEMETLEIIPTGPEVFGQGISYQKGNKTIVSLGIISDQLKKGFDIQQEVFYADFSWAMIMKLARKAKIVARPVPRYPAVRRDLALLIDEDVTFGQIRDLAKQTERKLLKSVGLFDVYEGEKISAHKKSYAVSFTFRDEDRTLTDKVIDKSMKRLITAFEKELGASIR